MHPPTSILTLFFPENYTWALEFAGGEIAHRIFHPKIYPHRIKIAEESGHELLPGLRWSELKQIVICLQQERTGTFDPQAVYPLLYPVVGMVTFAEYDEVRQTLHTVWETLQIFEPSQMKRWLDETIEVYEKNRRQQYHCCSC